MKTKPNRTTLIRSLALALAFGLSLWFGYNAMAAFMGQTTPISWLIPGGGRDQLNILLLGTDERGMEQARSDTIILANLNLEQNQVTLVSIPRDTRASIPGHGKQKINHAHAFGGPALLTRTVEGLLGVKVDYYLETNFEGFKNLIDQMGGITIDVEKRMYTPEEGINLKPGLQRLNGHDALAYVRFRHDAMGDIGRVERQQKFISAAYDQFFTLKNLLRAPVLINQALANVKTNMPTSEMLTVARFLKGVDRENIQTLTLPGYSQTIDGLSYWIVRDGEMRQMMAMITARERKY
ncbi:MAG: LCP family protein [Syntrophomonadaceae bacterium]|nr:LCP family protein [Syntrophomonadaceae bacterium]